MKNIIRPALLLLGVFLVITGFLYPLLITGISQLVFSKQANGSLIVKNGTVIGSELIGQQFEQPQYFWGRLSATSGVAYNASASGGSNYSVLNSSLADAVKARLAALKAADPENTSPVPVDLVTSSASGLDPQISIAAAEYQVARVARARGLSEQAIQAIVEKNIQRRWLGILGEPTVNVLKLNLALDALQ